ncbi:MAG: AAA family ATPase [Spirochaetales bacterium]|uniref:AAA family ATPase n=1 Tax=Bullifex sp. TaxID=2815808 RepID=UPI002A53312E|nr:AAA family ATPase [Bullifex sp.]MDD5972118.1 AAA family ATPase [Spirochaetales bacterium]MDD7270985.1 AAA family ATPase [Spirochaetales bacterium]MDY4067378.1 AAA family ATPase [Bullifex sp.]
MSDLFSSQEQISSQPLAYRMRPRNLDEYIGQEHIIGKGRLLRRAIQADLLSSVIFYGPPGTGKTTLARVIANTTKSHFATLNAVLSGVKELRYEIDMARDRLAHFSQKTILFVDEVHRWNKSQQDALLPWVENGTFILIGATTENPYFEVNAALVSRSRVFQLTKLNKDELKKVAYQALNDKERGYGNYSIVFEDGALEHLIDVAEGDARSLLNALQLAVETTPETFPPKAGSSIYISMDAAEESIQKKVVLYDKEGDYHFDVISAFIKSIRGSDPDASLYWLARMVAAGEDPRFIFRRMLISACEDVGLADPNAVTVVESCARAFDRIGLPEGRFHLTHAALYLATCPKSNSSLAFFDALKDVENEKGEEVPNHLKDASRDKNSFGHGEGYLYPHAYKDHWVSQQYLPSSLQGKMYYKPSEQGYEKTIKAEVERKREAQLESVSEDTFTENLTFSPANRKEDMWLKRTSLMGSKLLLEIRDELFKNINIKRSDNILVLNGSHGLILWNALRYNPEGFTACQVKTKEEFDYITHYKESLELLRQPEIYLGSAKDYLLSQGEDIRFEFIFAKNLFSRLFEEKDLITLLKKRIKIDGEIRLSESIARKGSRLSDFIYDKSAKELLRRAEKEIFDSSSNPITAWDEDDMLKLFSSYFTTVNGSCLTQTEEKVLDEQTLTLWLDKRYLKVLNDLGLYSEKLKPIVLNELKNKVVKWKHTVMIVTLSNKEVKIEKKETSPEWIEIHKKLGKQV